MEYKLYAVISTTKEYNPNSISIVLDIRNSEDICKSKRIIIMASGSRYNLGFLGRSKLSNFQKSEIVDLPKIRSNK